MSPRARGAAAVFAGALLARLALILAFPAVHGGDSVARLAHSDTLLLAYQLPLPQAVVVAVRAFWPDPFWTRLVFALFGAGVAASLAAVVWRLSGPGAGWAAGALAATHPLLVYYSIVPYQEGPMLLLLLLGADLLLAGRDVPAGIVLGLASLCRYEAWIAGALVLAWKVARARTWRGRARAMALFAWAPLAWMALWRGLGPPGTYVLDFETGAGWLSRLGFLAAKLRDYSGWPLLALAGAGLAVVARRSDARWLAGLGYVTLVVASVVVAGHEAPPGSGHVSERLAHLPALAACALAGLAVATAARAAPSAARPLARLAAALLVAALAVAGLRAARAQTAVAGSEPSLRLAVEVARFVEPRLAAHDRLGVAAPPVPAAAIEDYVRKVHSAGGDVEAARRIGRELAGRSVDADRLAAHLARPPSAVVTSADARPALVAVYDDAPAGAPWPLGRALARFTAGTRGVTVYLPAGAASPGANPTR